MSDDLSNWTQSVVGTLDKLTSTTGCGPTMFFLASATVKARYLRFRDISHYVNGPALAYFKVLAPGTRDMFNEPTDDVKISKPLISEVECKRVGLTYASTPIQETTTPDETVCRQVCQVSLST